MRRSLVLPILFFWAVTYIGIRVVENSWQGLVFINLEDPRSPAAVPGNINFSHLKGDDLWAAAHKRLLADARLLKSNSEIGIELGHFVVGGIDGKPHAACQVYNKVELTFAAEGLSVNGEAPEMVVLGTCGMDYSSIERIKPIWIPYQRVLMDKPGNIELSFFDEKPVTLKFDHMGSEWPKEWILKSVRLYTTEDSTRALNINNAQVREVTPQAMRLIW